MMFDYKKFSAGVYSLFVLSGAIKSVVPIQIPLDITLISGLICFLILLFKLFSTVKIPKDDFIFVIIFLIFFSLYVFSITSTPSPNYAIAKLSGAFLNFIAFIFPLLIRFNIKFFFNIFFSVALVISCVSILGRTFLPYSLYGDYLRQLYLTAGLIAGFAVLSALSNTFRSRNNYVFLIFIVILLLLGARGPLIFCSLLLIWVFITRVSVKKLSNCYVSRYSVCLSILLSIFFLALIIVNYQIFESQIARTLNRLSLLFAADKGNSINERLIYLDVASEMFSRSLLTGEGLGSFSYYYLGKDVRAYPHNVFLEIASESGFLTFMLFFFFCFAAAIKTFRYPVLFGIVIYALLNMSKSNAFEDLRIHFCFIGLCVLMSRRVVKNSEVDS